MRLDHTKFNQKDVLPEGAFRRNSVNYELVSYVNCLLGCRASDNKEGIDLFEDRIRNFIAHHQDEEGRERYYKAVRELLAE